MLGNWKNLISARRPDLIIINKKNRTYKTVDFAVPTDYRVKLKESEKRDKYFDFAREVKKLWNMKVTFIPIVIGYLGTVTEREWRTLKSEDEWTPSKLLHYWNQPEYCEESWRHEKTWRDMLSLKTQWKTIS